MSMWVLVTTILFTSGVEAKHRLPVNHAEAFPTWEKCELNRIAIEMGHRIDKGRGVKGVTFEDKLDMNYKPILVVKTKKTLTIHRCVESGKEKNPTKIPPMGRN